MIRQQVDVWLKPGLKSRSESWLHADFDREPFAWQEGKGGWPACSRAFICPFCLDQWATLRILQSGDPFSLSAVSCTLCAHPTVLHPIPGSLLDIPGTGAVDCGLLSALPESLLRREFNLTLKALSCSP